MKEFEDARTATEELFANEEQIPTEEPIAEEVPTEETVEEPTQESAMLDDAVNTVDVATQLAQEKEAQLQQALQELEALKAQNQQMQGTLDELSRQNEEKLVEEALQMPTLDINGLAFADEETVASEMAKFVEGLTAYNRAEMKKEFEPMLAYAKKGMQNEEKAETLSALSQVPELSGINDMLPQLDRIIANNKWLNSDDMSMEEKYINAYAIARGVNAINTPPSEPPKELTDDELMELYDKNPTFQELVEKKRIEAIKNSQQVPPFSASSGAVNAALNIKEKPKSWDDASERTRKMFGLE